MINMEEMIILKNVIDMDELAVCCRNFYITYNSLNEIKNDKLLNESKKLLEMKLNQKFNKLYKIMNNVEVM